MTKILNRNFPSTFATIPAVALGLLCILSVFFIFMPRPAISQTSATSIMGYAWSDNVGWIDLNCANATPGCSTWGLSVDGSGNVTGYGWSENIGWISAENGTNLAGCPSGPCTATLISGVLSGWFKVLSADNNGWDGWISLSGSGYGPTNSSGGYFNNTNNYAWGSDVVGWLSFANAYTPCTPSTVYGCIGQTIVSTTTTASCQVSTNNNVLTCTAPQFCSLGSAVCLYPTPVIVATLTVDPSLVPLNGTVTVSWNISNVSSCTVVGTNKDGTAAGSVGIWNTLSGPKTSSPILQQVIYTLDCKQYDTNAPDVIKTATVNVAPTYRER